MKYGSKNYETRRYDLSRSIQRACKRGVSAARAGDYASQSVKEYKRKGFEGKKFNAFIKEQAMLGKLRAIKDGKPRK